MTLVLERAQPSTAPNPHAIGKIARQLASEPQRWRPMVRFQPGRRIHVLNTPPGITALLVTWLKPVAGQSAHWDPLPVVIARSAAFIVIRGALIEHRQDPALGHWSTELSAPAVRVFAAGVQPQLELATAEPTISLHVYPRVPQP